MNFHPFFAVLLAFFLTFSAWTPVLPAAPQADDEPADEASDEPTQTYDEARAEAHAYAAQYKEFLSEARTEVTVVEESIRLAEQQGFRAFSEDSALTPGVKFYANNRDRALVLFVVGERPIREGLRIIAAHIDSPHLDLKPHPLQASGGFVKLQTLPNGYLKTYQWVNRPLALIGRVYKKDGQIVSINVGLRPSDPVFVIPDLAPHVDTSQRKRTARRVIGGEEMDPVAYSRVTKEQSKVLTNAKDHLKNVYGIEEEDFVSAELSFVPAQAPADVGFDGGLLGAYGQDDRSSAYAALRALLDLDGPRFTSVVFLADNEETGSNNNTGAKSSALNDLLAENDLSPGRRRLPRHLGSPGAARYPGRLCRRQPGRPSHLVVEPRACQRAEAGQRREHQALRTRPESQRRSHGSPAQALRRQRYPLADDDLQGRRRRRRHLGALPGRRQHGGH